VSQHLAGGTVHVDVVLDRAGLHLDVPDGAAVLGLPLGVGDLATSGGLDRDLLGGVHRDGIGGRRR
jgi:hypothetical protein